LVNGRGITTASAGPCRKTTGCRASTFNVEEWDAKGLTYETLAICRTLAPWPVQRSRLRSKTSPPAGSDWLDEIKHDGFRIMARRDAAGVRLITRNRQTLPLIVAAVAAFRASLILRRRQAG
jgi:ATP-dependent DNA ligase